MIQIALFHSHYSEEHLEAVKAEMQALGAPTIRAFWSEMHGIWLAVEGCHRLRAAAALGLTPNIEELSIDGTITVQVDEMDEDVEALDLMLELQDQASRTTILTFGGPR